MQKTSRQQTLAVINDATISNRYIVTDIMRYGLDLSGWGSWGLEIAGQPDDSLGCPTMHSTSPVPELLLILSNKNQIVSPFSTLKGWEESSSIQLSKLLNHLNVGQCYRQVDERQEPGHGVAPPDRDIGYTAFRTANLSPGRGTSRESQCRFNLYSYFADYLDQIQRTRGANECYP
jgi:hypothetical protein